MSNPFKDQTYNDSEDYGLIEAALNGSNQALEALIKRHQHYIYNIALKMVLSPFDAEDITQEVLVKMVTKLSQFRGKSSFRTWLYRITFNHFLNTKKNGLEEAITSFEGYGNELDTIEDVELTAQQQLEQQELIREANLGCMSGMLLCLSREQRLVYILGEIFEADHSIGADLLELSKVNFRKRLERARHDLYQFMNHKCGLINQNNPCRCARKTTGFIKAGWVDKQQMKFNTDYVHEIGHYLEEKSQHLNRLVETDYATLFKKTPFQEKEHSKKLLRTLLNDSKLKSLFRLD